MAEPMGAARPTPTVISLGIRYRSSTRLIARTYPVSTRDATKLARAFLGMRNAKLPPA